LGQISRGKGPAKAARKVVRTDEGPHKSISLTGKLQVEDLLTKKIKKERNRTLQRVKEASFNGMTVLNWRSLLFTRGSGEGHS